MRSGVRNGHQSIASDGPRSSGNERGMSRHRDNYPGNVTPALSQSPALNVQASSSTASQSIMQPWSHNSTSSTIYTESRRRLDEVEKVGQTECRLTTSLQTEYGGTDQANGIMFTVVPTSAMEVLTLEVDTATEDTVSVAVYFREGDFSGVTNDPQQWSLLTETEAERIPGEPGVIIPASDFRPVSMQADTTYSFYLLMKSGQDALRMIMVDTLIGQNFFNDTLGLMSVQTGVALDSAFPNSFLEPAQFSGRIHYKTTKPCESVRVSSVVELEFAVNEDPTEEVMAALSEAVRKSIEAIVILDVELIQYDKYDGLEITNADSAFMGITEDKCPPEFESCSNIFTTVTFLHLPTITAGEIQLQVFENEERIAESVITQSEYEVQYVGPPVIAMDFVVTLIGIPTDTRLNALQRRYLGRVTTVFLQRNDTVPIFLVEAKDEATTDQGSDERRLVGSAPRLRGTRKRRLQDAGSIQVVTTISGASRDQGIFLEAVLGGIDMNPKDYMQALASEQLRPGEINDGNSGQLFADISGASIVVKPANSTTNTGNGNSESSGPKTDNILYIALCSGFIFLSVAWLLCRVYRDFFARPPKAKDPTFDVLEKRASESERPRSNSSLGNRFDFMHSARPKSNPDLLLGSRSDHMPSAPLRSRSVDRIRSSSVDRIRSGSVERIRPRSVDRMPLAKPKSNPNLLGSNVNHLQSWRPRSNAVPENKSENSPFAKPSSTPDLPLLNSAISPSLSSNRPQNKPSLVGDPVNRAGNSRGIKPSKSLPLDLMVQKPVQDKVLEPSGRVVAQRAKKRPKAAVKTSKPRGKKQGSSSSDISTASGHSIRSAPDLKLPKQPIRTSDDQSVTSGGAVSLPDTGTKQTVPLQLPKQPTRTLDDQSVTSGGAVSLPDIGTNQTIPVKDSKLPAVKRGGSREDISTSGHSIRSAPELKGTHSDERFVTSGGAKRLPDNRVKRRVFEKIDSSSSHASLSSEESDIDDAILVKSVSMGSRIEEKTKTKTPPPGWVATKDHSESSEESDFEDFVPTLVNKSISKENKPASFRKPPKRADESISARSVPSRSLSGADGKNKKSGTKSVTSEKKQTKTKKAAKAIVLAGASPKADAKNKKKAVSDDETTKGNKQKKNPPKKKAVKSGIDTKQRQKSETDVSTVVLKEATASEQKTPLTVTSTATRSNSNHGTSTEPIVAENLDSASSSSESDFDGETVPPLRRFVIHQKNAASDDDDDISAVSSITTGFDSTYSRPKTFKDTGTENTTDPELNMTAQAKTTSVYCNSPGVLSSLTQDRFPSPGTGANPSLHRWNIDERPATAAIPSSSAENREIPQLLSQEQKIASIINLQETSVPPIDPSQSLMKSSSLFNNQIQSESMVGHATLHPATVDLRPEDKTIPSIEIPQILSQAQQIASIIDLQDTSVPPIDPSQSLMKSSSPFDDQIQSESMVGHATLHPPTVDLRPGDKSIPSIEIPQLLSQAQKIASIINLQDTSVPPIDPSQALMKSSSPFDDQIQSKSMVGHATLHQPTVDSRPGDKTIPSSSLSQSLIKSSSPFDDQIQSKSMAGHATLHPPTVDLRPEDKTIPLSSIITTGVSEPLSKEEKPAAFRRHLQDTSVPVIDLIQSLLKPSSPFDDQAQSTSTDGYATLHQPTVGLTPGDRTIPASSAATIAMVEPLSKEESDAAIRSRLHDTSVPPMDLSNDQVQSTSPEGPLSKEEKAAAFRRHLQDTSIPPIELRSLLKSSSPFGDQTQSTSTDGHATLHPPTVDLRPGDRTIPLSSIITTGILEPLAKEEKAAAIRRHLQDTSVPVIDLIHSLLKPSSPFDDQAQSTSTDGYATLHQPTVGLTPGDRTIPASSAATIAMVEPLSKEESDAAIRSRLHDTSVPPMDLSNDQVQSTSPEGPLSKEEKAAAFRRHLQDTSIPPVELRSLLKSSSPFGDQTQSTSTDGHTTLLQPTVDLRPGDRTMLSSSASTIAMAELLSKEEKAAVIRIHLRDTSVPPMDLSHDQVHFTSTEGLATSHPPTVGLRPRDKTMLSSSSVTSGILEPLTKDLNARAFVPPDDLSSLLEPSSPFDDQIHTAATNRHATLDHRTVDLRPGDKTIPSSPTATIKIPQLLSQEQKITSIIDLQDTSVPPIDPSQSLIKSSSPFDDQIQSKSMVGHATSDHPTVDLRPGDKSIPSSSAGNIEIPQLLLQAQKIASIVDLQDTSVPPIDPSQALIKSSSPFDDQIHSKSMVGHATLHQPTVDSRPVDKTIPLSSLMTTGVSEPLSKDEKVAAIRSHLQDTAVPPIDLSHTILRPNYQRDWDDEEETSESSSQASYGNTGNIISGNFVGKSNWFEQTDYTDIKSSLNPQAALRKDLLGPTGTVLVRSSLRDSLRNELVRPATSAGENGRIATTERLNLGAAKKSALRGGTKSHSIPSRDAPPRAVARDTSDECWIPLAPSPELSHTSSNENLHRVLSAEALKLREIARGVRRTASADRLGPPSGSTDRESIRRHIQRTRSQEKLSTDGGDSHRTRNKWGDLVRTYSNEHLVQVTASNVDRRSTLKRTASDERRGAIASHLKNILGDKGAKR